MQRLLPRVALALKNIVIQQQLALHRMPAYFRKRQRTTGAVMPVILVLVLDTNYETNGSRIMVGLLVSSVIDGI